MSTSAPTPDAVLVAAARAEVLAVGLTKATATSIARRAGVARVTVYRRGGTIRRLVLEAVTHETRRLVAEATEGLPGDDTDGLTQATALACRLLSAVAESELLRSLCTHDSDVLVPYLTGRLGSSQVALVNALEPAIVAGTRDGSIREGRPDVMATVLLEALTAFTLAHPMLVSRLGEGTLDAEVSRLVKGYLAAEPAP